MARALVALTEDVWTDLGTAEMIIEVAKEGRSGGLLLNQAETEVAALVIPKGSAGWQFSNTKATDTIFAKASAPGWSVIVDI